MVRFVEKTAQIKAGGVRQKVSVVTVFAGLMSYLKFKGEIK